MCTEVCPCLSVESWETDSFNNKIRRNDPEFIYSRLNEEMLNRHNRTNDITKM